MDKVFTILFFGFIFLCLGYSKEYNEEFDTYTQFLSSSALKEKKIPEVPISASKIKVLHFSGIVFENTSAVLMYSYKGSFHDSHLLKNNCKERSSDKVIPPENYPSFWPNDMDNSYSFYRCQSLKGFYAISEKKSTVVFWKK